MKKVDRQPEHKPAEPYAGGLDPKPETGRRAPNVPQKDKSKAPRRPEEHHGNPLETQDTRVGGKDNFQDERSDRPSSGRPLQLDEEEEGQQPQPGRGGEPGYGERPREDRTFPEGHPLKR
jgi:hypothetical protein